MNDYLSFGEVAEKLKSPLEKVRRLVIESKTLKATRITKNGLVLESCGLDSHFPYDLDFCCHLDDMGAITSDLYESNSVGKTVLTQTFDVGFLRVERSDLKRFITEHTHSQQPDTQSHAAPTVTVPDFAEYVSNRGMTVLVKAPEQSTQPQAATPSPAPVGMTASDGTAKPAWSLKRPERFPGYRKPLYDFLKAAHAAGQPKPGARDVLDKWKENPPPDVATVTDNGLKYYDAKGNTKPADLDAIRKAIDRIIR